MTNSIKSINCLCILVAGLLTWSWAHAQADPALPYESPTDHLGVASCAGSTCHGSTIARESNVEQNEYLVWNDTEFPDKHAEAYDALFGELAETIAGRLNLESAHEAQVCLDCHTDPVPAEQRGEQFSLEDGVGCEACHGGAERYLDAHNEPDATHQRNIELGMYPTEEPAARARLCLSCHFGNDDKYVGHDIISAGHPRLSFELDTFTADQPAHFVVDEDYAERKGVWTAVQTWAIGQTVAARRFVNAIREGDHGGLFPELTLFDCYSCHRSMDDGDWRPRQAVGLGPGSLRFNDANLLMTYQLARVVAPDEAKGIQDGIRALHRATRGNAEAVDQACRDLLARLDGMEAALDGHSFSASDMYGLINNLVDHAVQGEYRDYADAEQTVMAISSVLVALEQSGDFDRERGDTLFGALDKVFKTMESASDFRPAGFESALQDFRQLLPG